MHITNFLTVFWNLMPHQWTYYHRVSQSTCLVSTLFILFDVTHKDDYSNQVSLEIVSNSFDEVDDHPKALLPPSQDMPIFQGTLTVPQAFSTPQSGSADSVNDNTERPALNDGMLSYIKTSITSLISKSTPHWWSPSYPYKFTEGVGGDVSKFKPSNFPWTTLAVILADQGLVMWGWPASVLMPGEPHTSTAQIKGITVLKKGEQCALYNTFENQEITITRLEGNDERSK